MICVIEYKSIESKTQQRKKQNTTKKETQKTPASWIVFSWGRGIGLIRFSLNDTI